MYEDAVNRSKLWAYRYGKFARGFGSEAVDRGVRATMQVQRDGRDLNPEADGGTEVNPGTGRESNLRKEADFCLVAPQRGTELREAGDTLCRFIESLGGRCGTIRCGDYVIQ